MFINAVNEVVRQNAESKLKDEHIEKIRNAYFDYSDLENFSKVVSKKDILSNNADLTISLYVSPKSNITTDILSLEDAITNWQASSNKVQGSFTSLVNLING